LKAAFALFEKGGVFFMHPAAIGIVLRPGAKPSSQEVLLVRRRDVPIWVLPGGGIDPGESAAEAALREVEEESGVCCQIERHSAHYTPLNRLTRHTDTFVCSVVEGSPKASDECSDARYFALDQLPQDYFPLHLYWLEDALQNRKEPIHRPITEVTYCSVLWGTLTHPRSALRYFWTRLGPGGRKN
jgi:8-oxo-dGTP pyrophosphatase MutT (NUDIX family)